MSDTKYLLTLNLDPANSGVCLSFFQTLSFSLLFCSVLLLFTHINSLAVFLSYTNKFTNWHRKSRPLILKIIFNNEKTQFNAISQLTNNCSEFNTNANVATKIRYYFVNDRFPQSLRIHNLQVVQTNLCIGN